MRLVVVTGDITQVSVDAVVNAANEWMLGGGGVDGAIHDAAGEELLEACRAIPEVAPGVRCPTGEARITPGFALPARFVIHTVGPRWRGGARGEDEALASAYRSSLALAEENGLQTIAFPAISTGAFGFPVERAATIAVRTVAAALERHPTIRRVELVCFDEGTRRIFAKALAARG
jgi:O-acetyl-ADP-ribose deacetylase